MTTATALGISPTDRELAGMLDRQIDTMQAVLAVLEAEHAALNARDAGALMQAVSDKADRIAEAGALDAQRRSTFAFPLSGFMSGKGRFSADAGVAHRWQQLIALAERCRSLNESNGQLIRGQRRRVDQALSLLRGESLLASPEYGPKGDPRPRYLSRSLASV